MKRRELITTGVLSIAALNTACSAQTNLDQTLQVGLLTQAIPNQLIDQFKKTLGGGEFVNIQTIDNLILAYQNLQDWFNPPAKTPSFFKIFSSSDPIIENIIPLGNYWLRQAIALQWLNPIPIDNIPNWKTLPPQWKTLVQRDKSGAKSATGQIWGAPYRWGTTMIVYNKDKFQSLGWTPTDWKDLWNPQLQDKFSLLDQPREVIGLTLKKLGHSYNTEDITKIPNLKSELTSLNQLVKFYSSDAYLQPLLSEDTWLAVGWSNEIFSLIKSDQRFAAIVPPSGTSLWSELWVIPKKDANPTINNLIPKWIDFFWQPNIATFISRYSNAASVIMTDIPKVLQENKALFPNTTILDKSEFIYPLSSLATKAYSDLWIQIRQNRV